jgi:hypothetical protein
VVKDITRAKFFSRRYSYSYTLTFNLAAKTYSFAPPVTAATGTPKIDGTLPKDAKFVAVPTPVTITAPFGRVNTVSPNSIQLGLTNSSGITAKIDMVGVTGMVIARGIE